MDDEIELIYPCFLITDAFDDPIVAEAEGADWCMLYASKELAELYIEQSRAQDEMAVLAPRQINSERELVVLLIDCPAVAGFVSNSVIQPQVFRFLDRSEFD